MKKLLIILVITLLSVSSYAQRDVTTFLGIPVDGTKSEMRQKLIAKGFAPEKSGNNEYLEGEFNGTDVQVYIITNNNKVYRIMVCDAISQSETNIKNRFNKLVSQFERNKRYTTLADYTISTTEDISYEMLVHKKNYEALFFQEIDTSTVTSEALAKEAAEQLLEKYTPEQLENPDEELYQEILDLSARLYLDVLKKKSVWFKICEHRGEYYIAMYYDNEYNRADGEDL